MSVAKWAARPASAEQLLESILQNARSGDIISVKSAIQSIRDLDPYPSVTDEELTADIVEVATGRGLFVCFDSHE
ncbi:hypothetical protein EH240_03715 [Mesorhizobium tamadayense]|uniref:Uncharacterized protein n=1 Tax=Mesorhizobium tamadayense TaxID=425306 RepID=A0A3P3G688_9HYPH|nr:hypothetical protein [Mesorhizobium tamadayense]RRI06390.1 hypothetical protein EH240_03715 [Mesorhizobium tamadayense]